MVRRSLREVLRGLSLRVEQAASGLEALGLLVERSFDLVLLDLRMPRLGGLTVLQYLSKNMPSTPTVVLTGEANIDNAKGAMALGAFEFLTKPVAPDRLTKTVRAALDGAGLRLISC